MAQRISQPPSKPHPTSENSGVFLKTRVTVKRIMVCANVYLAQEKLARFSVIICWLCCQNTNKITRIQCDLWRLLSKNSPWPGAYLHRPSQNYNCSKKLATPLTGSNFLTKPLIYLCVTIIILRIFISLSLNHKQSLIKQFIIFFFLCKWVHLTRQNNTLLINRFLIL